MRAGLLLLAALLAAGCAAQRRSGVPLLDARSVRVVTDDGPWKPVAEEEEIGGPWRVANGGFERVLEPVEDEPLRIAPPEPEPPAQPAVVAPPAAPKLAIPRRRARKEARPVGKKVTKSRALLARDHFTDYPTRIVGRSITLHAPPDLARRARLEGQQVDTLARGRRQALGGARLTLGELTLEGERITLRTRDDGRNDLQVMARGEVGFVAEVRGNILREEGLRSLLITNDQVVPLR
ncbi:MAG: hypothetical protein QNJ90_14580 [Planctomycetota bacterium]|nr:hypothetical protein [Planctomycetota bacterium]